MLVLIALVLTLLIFVMNPIRWIGLVALCLLVYFFPLHSLILALIAMGVLYFISIF